MTARICGSNLWKEKTVDEPICVAIIGIGNCACSLIQGLWYYKSKLRTEGLINAIIGGYRVSDIRIVAGFDVNKKKIGKDVSEAIFVKPNNARKFSRVPRTGVAVSPGYLGDGIAKHLRKHVPTQESATRAEIVKVLKESGARIAICFLPVGSQKAVAVYAQACIEAGVAFINAMPRFIASDPRWVKKFERAGIPCAGDDVMSQLGATILHRVLLEIARERGFKISSSLQTNEGGNMDFLCMQDLVRIVTKLISKTDCLVKTGGTMRVHVEPAKYNARRKDKKITRITIWMKQFGGLPSKLELTHEVEDSPNSAGVIIDAIRFMQISLDRKLKGYQDWSARYFKHPLRFMSLPHGRKQAEAFLAGR